MEDHMHTVDCVTHWMPPNFCDDDITCEALKGEWMQPPGYYVTEAQNFLDQFIEQAPWCRVRELAWTLSGECE